DQTHGAVKTRGRINSVTAAVGEFEAPVAETIPLSDEDFFGCRTAVSARSRAAGVEQRNPGIARGAGRNPALGEEGDPDRLIRRCATARSVECRQPALLIDSPLSAVVLGLASRGAERKRAGRVRQRSADDADPGVVA